MGGKPKPKDEPAPTIGPPQDRHRAPCGLCHGHKEFVAVPGEPPVPCTACKQTGYR